MKLNFGITFEDLYSRDGLVKLDKAFVGELAQANADVHNRFVAARADRSQMEEKEVSNLLIDVAPHLEDFTASLFKIQKETKALAKEHDELANIYTCKRLFVQRQVAKKYKAVDVQDVDGDALRKDLEKALGGALSEKLYSDTVNAWLEDADKNEANIDMAAKYAAWALHTDNGKKYHKSGVLFKVPNKLDFFNLVPVETTQKHGITVQKLPDESIHYRDGFALTDKGISLKQALDDANYCIYCHNQGKDSCSKGLREKDGSVKKTALDVKQAGCPLEEKISEMNTLKARGVSIGALAVVTIDNPMCAGTGHRICNDCMKGCIYQKQDPVNIPRNETRVLQDVLDLPYGFEIYSLFTRWNPLNLDRPLPAEDTGYKVLVAGLGPAGFTLAHHLLNDGHTVVAVDGLKIEPLPEDISGVTQKGMRVPFKPIKDIKEIFEDLGERVLAGFGGVAEYGITVRWNKNYLKVIRLLLERRRTFAMYGGVRFGSTITYDDAFKRYGFDHIALCMGAGKPTVIDMPNAMARGVRTASDFLMSLQLSGAAKKDTIANLQLRLPVAVIGGGLTAVDTATESLAYYPFQVEKFLRRYEALVEELGEDEVRKRWNLEEREIGDEFINHAKAIRLEKEAAHEEGRKPNIVKLIKGWGGVKVVYRKNLHDSPAYRLNHEEVELALEEGIEFVPNASPVSVELDKYAHAEALKVSVSSPHPEGEGTKQAREELIQAKSIFMAAGTNPNTVLQREDSEHFELDGKYFKAIDENGNQVKPEWDSSKPEEIHVLLSKTDNDKFVSFFGDMHPSYVGNVVKAMGAAKQGCPIITNILNKASRSNSDKSDKFIKYMNNELLARVYKVERLTSNIVEVVVKAPAAARGFNPGQFYRLQNYETNAATVTDNHNNKTKLAMEGLALTGAWVDKEEGLLSTIVLEMGGSSDLCYYLQKDEPIVLMGPTGEPTETPAGETVMLVGGGLGNAVLFSIGKALKANGSRVLYFAGYKKAQDRYKIKDIEEASDVIIWACDEATFTPEREQDRAFHGNIVKAIEAYGSGMLGKCSIKVEDVDRIIAIGSHRMMEAVGKARHTVLKDMLKPDHKAIGSINSPMQCMMKEICAQCLQKHIDPDTGKEYYVYSCFNQDQDLDSVSFDHLDQRLAQNGIHEKLSALWINRCLEQLNLRKKAA
ncbi:MAG: FAD-dependent oxidoreductase [Rickettsiales bacterium]|nr:FAD-dependent oxidoreductase [Pseudomonadota bacterium]MDA0965600.1 FAD-dependent oxidoreductase [Pseudomonadota bacterium]MDG4542924.1 FAD-dependent oxidoreductase [Rickettsiales bacterium]MDG4544628.1 FAD-dependent oxidoreductase [Rickettsiales bacterium]MDG4546750.1 FAD-dependent oxidoreductase [Rickettsiales bacterium]